ncbi:MAG: hypothetical protein ACKOA8_18565, partial [Deltaproteobacteria bacterium]
MPSDWNQSIPTRGQELISYYRKELEEVFGSKSYVFCYFRYQLGEKSQAKDTLHVLYEEEFAKVMNLQRAEYGLGHSPLTEAEKLYQALMPLCHPGEREKLRSEMQKMKTHLSNLP